MLEFTVYAVAVVAVIAYLAFTYSKETSPFTMVDWHKRAGVAWTAELQRTQKQRKEIVDWSEINRMATRIPQNVEHVDA